MAKTKSDNIEFLGDDGTAYRTYEAADGTIRAKRIKSGWDDGDHEISKSSENLKQAVESKHKNSNFKVVKKSLDLRSSVKCVEDSASAIMGAQWSEIADEVELGGKVPVLSVSGQVVGIANDLGESLQLVLICNRPPHTEVKRKIIDGKVFGEVADV